MAPPAHTSDISLYSIYRPRKDERLSWPGWLIFSGRFTHIVATRQLKVERRTGSVRWPKTGVSSTVLRNQPEEQLVLTCLGCYGIRAAKPLCIVLHNNNINVCCRHSLQIHSASNVLRQHQAVPLERAQAANGPVYV